ncbi:uncharacterized protein TRAVEDRAFT_46490 [Trametes versicolor FP-101664 SS1]|uniref:uncharacterized protein n=1 Tax=Trametes versicolor (strain FP-101664) TaxID=717944 RepID=UPI00046244D4|nr:uncharacterized protein TRAVEDRAFT_46490 [Trametes versicolor FP-101664 SS1]EIW59182.1 hypothetical protein TRAVEDRAFT_46490 [Trametes versicolor FP-101664 SS1]
MWKHIGVLSSPRQHRLKAGLLKAAQTFDSASGKFKEFQDVFYDKKSQLTAAELHEYDDVFDTFKKTMAVFESQVSFSREAMSDFEPVFRLLDRTPNQIRVLTRPLNDAKSQIQNAIAARALLARLQMLHDRRRALEQRSEALFVVVSSLFVGAAPLTSEVVQEQLAKFVALHRTLEDLGLEQAQTTTTLQKVFERTSSPLMLAGTSAGALFSVVDLRNAYKVFTQIYDAVDMMHEMSDPLTAALARATIQLKARASFNIRVFALSGAALRA